MHALLCIGRKDKSEPIDKHSLSRQDSSVVLTENQVEFPIIENGRLPNAHKDHHHVREVFERMVSFYNFNLLMFKYQGMNDQETVALIGAHCVGRCHTYNSGFHGRKMIHISYSI